MKEDRDPKFQEHLEKMEADYKKKMEKEKEERMAKEGKY